MAVKPKYIKALGREIFETYEESIDSDFERNKMVVRETTDVKSREVRNRVAGYLCSLSRKSKQNQQQLI